MVAFASPSELHELFDVLTDREQPTPTFLQSYFARQHLFETETLDLDKIEPDLRIAIYVAAANQAKATVRRGYDTKVFRAAYWKDKSTVDVRNILQRSFGEKFGQGAANEAKFQREIMTAMTLIEAKRTRLLEWQAAELLLNGKYTAQSELHPAVTIDMERNTVTTETGLNGGRANQADLTTITANGGVGKRAWGSTGGTKTVSPIADLGEMMEAAFEPIAAIIISNNAWAELVKDTDFKNTIDSTLTTNSIFTAELLPVQFSKEGLKLRGVMNSVPIWTYNADYQKVTDASTTLTKFIPDGYVVMVPNARFGVSAFGYINHAEANFVASPLFWNSWITKEEGQYWVQGQAAPIMIHTKINSTVAWKVM